MRCPRENVRKVCQSICENVVSSCILCRGTQRSERFAFSNSVLPPVTDKVQCALRRKAYAGLCTKSLSQQKFSQLIDTRALVRNDLLRRLVLLVPDSNVRHT